MYVNAEKNSILLFCVGAGHPIIQLQYDDEIQNQISIWYLNFGFIILGNKRQNDRRITTTVTIITKKLFAVSTQVQLMVKDKSSNLK